jgi:hypothetical protein
MVAQFPEPNSDAAWALSALSNGEAEFMEAQWAQQYLQEGSWDALHAEEEQHLAETDAPPLITAQDRYPYWLGKEFAESSYASGGWGAVNALFANPPVSSRQVLHPDAYWAGVMPLSVEPPTASALASRGWAPLMDDTFGEVGLRAILEPFLGPEAAAASVDGWSGDRYTLLGAPTVRLPLSSPSTVWWYGRPEVLALETVWDDTTASRRFFDGLANSLDVRFGRDTRQISSGRLMWGGTDLWASVELDGNHVRYVVAPDRASLLAVTAPSS